MDTFSVQVFPVARPDEWSQFMREIDSGERAGAHRDLLRRLGVTKEHVFRQDTPMGVIMVLVWEGVAQADLGKLMGEMIASPQTDHERYLATHVIPVLHGVDPTAGPPPEMHEVASITV